MKIEIGLSEAKQVLSGLELVDGLTPREKDFEHIDPEDHADLRDDRKIIEARIRSWESRVRRLEK